jgi:hypothetical protein
MPRVFLARKPHSPKRAFRRPTSIPLCDLRDLCAMLSPTRVFLARKPSSPPKAVHRPKGREKGKAILK